MKKIEAKAAAGPTSAEVEPRDIDEDDVCPVCQEELLAEDEPLTHCRFGCGGNIHVKCMHDWAKHARSTGETAIKCPFCREDFGPLADIDKEKKATSRRQTRAERANTHLGTECVGGCQRNPATPHIIISRPVHTEHVPEGERWWAGAPVIGNVLLSLSFLFFLTCAPLMTSRHSKAAM